MKALIAKAWPYLLSGLLVLVVVASLNWYGDKREDEGYGRRDLEARAEVSAAQQQARDEERRRITEQEKLKDEADQELAAAVERERRAGDVRVRQAVADYARRHRPAGDPSAAQSGAAADDPIGVLAVVLGELDDLAGIYAAQADRARIAGLTCERAYRAVKGQ